MKMTVRELSLSVPGKSLQRHVVVRYFTLLLFNSSAWPLLNNIFTLDNFSRPSSVGYQLPEPDFPTCRPLTLSLKRSYANFLSKRSSFAQRFLHQNQHLEKMCAWNQERRRRKGGPFVFPTAAIRNGGIAFLGEGETIMLSFSPFGSFSLCCGNSTDAHFYLL